MPQWRESKRWANRAGQPVVWLDKPPVSFGEILIHLVHGSSFAVLVCEGCQAARPATEAEAEQHARTCDKTSEGS